MHEKLITERSNDLSVSFRIDILCDYLSQQVQSNSGASEVTVISDVTSVDHTLASPSPLYAFKVYLYFPSSTISSVASPQSLKSLSVSKSLSARSCGRSSVSVPHASVTAPHVCLYSSAPSQVGTPCSSLSKHHVGCAP